MCNESRRYRSIENFLATDPKKDIWRKRSSGLIELYEELPITNIITVQMMRLLGHVTSIGEESPNQLGFVEDYLEGDKQKYNKKKWL